MADAVVKYRNFETTKTFRISDMVDISEISAIGKMAKIRQIGDIEK